MWLVPVFYGPVVLSGNQHEACVGDAFGRNLHGKTAKHTCIVYSVLRAGATAPALRDTSVHITMAGIRSRIMLIEADRYSKGVLEPIAEGRVPVESDRGGNWSAEYGLWVNSEITRALDRLDQRERQVAEAFVPAALTAGRLFTKQLQDGADRIMWPDAVFSESGADAVIQASLSNPSLYDPYSLLHKGLMEPSLPYSRAYPLELSGLRQLLGKLSVIDAPSAAAHREFLTRLMEAYRYDPQRESDLPFYREAETAWVGIRPDSGLLLFIQPMEVYYDSARMYWSGNDDMNDWAQVVSRKNGLGPWRTFFEARLLATDESMIPPGHVAMIRRVSRDMYADTAVEVPASTEFREVLFSAGNGAHPHKTAKNYPNFIGIREQTGYKNIHYTNMIRLGTTERLKPWLAHTFGDGILRGLDDATLIRGRALAIVGHEENHPFRRFDGNQELEELKATVNGMWAVLSAGIFSEPEIRAMLLTEVGSLLYGKAERDKLLSDGDLVGVGSRDTYHIGDTMLMNILVREQVVTEAGVDLLGMARVIGETVGELERYRRTGEGLFADRSLRDSAVWERFSIKAV